jgi:hypothetical protein
MSTEKEDIEIVEVEDADGEFGYSDHAWTELSDDEVSLHDEVIALSYTELADAHRNHESHLVRWAAAQLCADNDDFDAFDEIAYTIVREPWEHAALDYEEIAVELFVDSCLGSDEQRCNRLIDLLDERLGSQDLEVLRMRAFRDMIFEHRERGLDAYQSLIDDFSDQVELIVQIIYDFILFGEFELARELLDTTREELLLHKDDDAMALLNDAELTLESAERGVDDD